MGLPSLFDVCTPRDDVLRGSITESDFAADLAQVLTGRAHADYTEPARFFANTHPTRGLKDLLRNVCLRLQGHPDQVAPIFRLDTSFGGGKTHALIALSHAAQGMAGVGNVEEFIDPALLPGGPVRVAAFDGENADPSNGRPLGDGIRAYTPWGELAYALAGPGGYAKLAESDRVRNAPGSATIAELFGDQPTLILLDELAIYLRKLRGRERTDAGRQLVAFLSALFKAVESAPNAALVYTLAIGKTQSGARTSADAYADENQFIADAMEEAESISARKATILDPTEEDETVKILRRRLFAAIDDEAAGEIVAEYRRIWEANREHLPQEGMSQRVEAFVEGFPFHPELIETLKEKTSTLSTFQRVRGMLRLLTRTTALLWQTHPKDAHAIHLHHIDPGFEPIRQEIVTRMGLRQYVPAILADIADGSGGAMAQEMDGGQYAGLPPYGSYVGRVILMHSFAFNSSLQGVTPDRLRYAIASPTLDLGFVKDAVDRFVAGSAYLDDRPHAPLRFLTEANLTQLIRQQERHVEPAEVRSELNDRVRRIFGSGRTFSPVFFPGDAYDVGDDAGEGRPTLAVMGWDAVSIPADAVSIPPLVERIFRHKGSGGDLRLNRNNLVFLIADDARKDEMRRKMVRRLALEELRRPEHLNELAEHQRDQLMEQFRKAETEVTTAIQQGYRHVLYPSAAPVERATAPLAHTAIDVAAASEGPGDGQRQVVRALQDNNKLRLPEDEPDSPTYVRDRTPLKKGSITTAALRAEFRKDPRLPMLVGDDVFRKGIRRGIETGEYVYRNGDLFCGRGDPLAAIQIDEQSIVYTAAYARENDLWPRPEPEGSGQGKDASGAGEGATAAGGGMEEGPTGGTDNAGGQSSTGSRGGDAGAVGGFVAEAVLKEALAQVWEKARAAKVAAIRRLILRIYEPQDGFRLLGLVGGVPDAEKRVAIEGDYATEPGSKCTIEFAGTIDDAKPVKDFLDPQLRAAADSDVQVEFAMTFPDGLPLQGSAPEKLADQLARFGTGAVFVRAEAMADA